ncbi:hypothetical protein CDAR_541831 [Caerostris darwini]|uniref:Uncharacterized protein n=1 Tax=Caerostris darwini TaxID=1538125 RepID=A0AAV4UUA3_9ARAC|nr:hypothetical protein CDAR_541831 [Caerostris darwini]
MQNSGMRNPLFSRESLQVKSSSSARPCPRTKSAPIRIEHRKRRRSSLPTAVPIPEAIGISHSVHPVHCLHPTILCFRCYLVEVRCSYSGDHKMVCAVHLETNKVV